MNALKEKYYITEIFKTKLGNSRGTPIKAKPLYVLAIISCVEDGTIKDNCIYPQCEELRDKYYGLYAEYEPTMKPSPFVLPFFHLSNESYYNIKWTGKPFVPSPHAHSPSEKYIRENVAFAYLENSLWDILKEPEARSRIREQILQFYFKPTQS